MTITTLKSHTTFRYNYNQIQIPPHSWCESQIKGYVSSSDVSMESVQDEEIPYSTNSVILNSVRNTIIGI